MTRKLSKLSLPYPLQLMWQGYPALRLALVSLGGIPLSQTPCIRSSWPYPFRVLHADPCTITRGRIQGLPILAQGVSVHAWGLRPRRVLISLAITVYEMLFSVHFKTVNTRNYLHFGAQYPACTYPCQRFDISVATDTA
jgi:hypothetical protein